MKNSTKLIIFSITVVMLQSCNIAKTCPTYSQTPKTNKIFLI